MVKAFERFEQFSLLGGPLYRLGYRLGLIRGGTNTVALGLALGFFCWAVLLALAFIEGISEQILSLSVIGGHVRLVVAIPLFFACESILDPRMTTFVRGLVASGIVRGEALAKLESLIARISRWTDSWWPDALCLSAAVFYFLFVPGLSLPGGSATHDPSRTFGEMTLTGQWYWIVCMTLFRFLMLRWLWRLILWWYFLWCLARLALNLVPTHPDGAGGLGYLEVVHAEFALLILAISTVTAAAFAESIGSGRTAFEAIYPMLALLLIVDVGLFLGPLFILAPKLWLCRVTGLDTYMHLAARYVNDFDRKWLGANAVPGEPLLGTADVQSLADLSNSVNLVRNMRLVPVSQRLLLDLAVAALLPMLPLLLLKYPATELAQKLLNIMFSL